ncbi:hypothetical protein ONZ45_g10003 [Pleurotus djamor]|nr:hypothetical protein ONZ45_g10003 [Pleurotus djamor]
MSTFASTNSPFIDGPLPPISPAEVNDHLHLLSAFYNFLREAILIYTTIHPSASRQDAYESITRRSAYRLELWVTTILKENVAANPKHRGFPIDGVPPFDVAMALLALMLSPHRFYEDSRLRLPQLQQIGDYPLSHLVSLLVGSGWEYDSNKVQASADLWTQRTSLHYDPIQALHVDAQFVVECPSCHESVSLTWKDYTPESKHPCGHCHFEVSRDGLCTAKFLEALNQVGNVPLPNTIEMLFGNFDVEAASELSSQVVDLLKKENGELPSIIEIHESATRARLTRDMDYIKTAFQQKKQTLLAFQDSTIFTQSITTALATATKFIMNMEACFHNEDATLAPSIVSDPHSKALQPKSAFDFDFDRGYFEYLRFLRGLSDEPQEGPPPHVDMIWHTHMLKASYRDDCLRFVHLFPNHVPYGEIATPRTSLCTKDTDRATGTGTKGGTEVIRDADTRIINQIKVTANIFTELAQGHTDIGDAVPGEQDQRRIIAQEYTKISGLFNQISQAWAVIKDNRPPHTSTSLGDEIGSRPRLPYRSLATAFSAFSSDLGTLNGVHQCQD